MAKQNNNSNNGVLLQGKAPKVGFGTFKGVYLPSVLTIFGVIMYLRLGWVVGNVGLLLTLVIVTISSTITFLTGLSISATATNMNVGGGGAYFMISRSFGVEAGTAVGIPLFFAQAIGISFYIAGFSESINALLPHIPLPVIGIASLVILTVLAYISADVALKAQLFIFAIIIASLLSFFLGGPVRPDSAIATMKVLPRASFWTAFAVFFPAVTGIEAGISMSGDLKDPAKSLPWGTLLAVISGYVVYMIIPIFFSFVAPREMLRSNPMIMRDVAFIGILILFGIWGATLSSALGALLGAPRTLQALARDKVIPQFLGKGYGPADTPRIATAFSFMIAFIGIVLGDINAIAPVLSMFFLTSYGVLNCIAGFEGLIGNPSWRPTFRVHWALSLIGSALCLITMLMINPGATFIALFIIVVIYYIMIKRDINARWSDIRRSILLSLARYSIYRLADSRSDVRTWRPNMLVLSGAPTQRFYLIHLADALTHGKGFLTVAAIIPKEDVAEERLERLGKSIKEFLRKKQIPALVEVNVAEDVIAGAKAFIRTYGLGPLAPNTILLGETEKRENFLRFAELIKLIYQSKRNLVIMREGDTPHAERHKKQIFVWWGGGEQNNAGLMLALGYLLQTSPEWKGSQLTIKTIVKSEEDKVKMTENVKAFLAHGRVPAQLEVLVSSKTEDIIASTIRNFSQNADLVLLGMKAPYPDESPEAYAAYYENLIKSTKKFPPLAFVLAAEEINFSSLFK
ncbi:MAG: amino acid permease [bacterium]